MLARRLGVCRSAVCLRESTSCAFIAKPFVLLFIPVYFSLFLLNKHVCHFCAAVACCAILWNPLQNRLEDKCEKPQKLILNSESSVQHQAGNLLIQILHRVASGVYRSTGIHRMMHPEEKKCKRKHLAALPQRAIKHCVLLYPSSPHPLSVTFLEIFYTQFVFYTKSNYFHLDLET